MKQIAFILIASSLERDDRVRKVALSLSEMADVKIFVFFKDNRSEEGVTSYGVPYKSYPLKTCGIFPSQRMMGLKAAEFLIRARRDLASYDMIYVHDQWSFQFLFCYSRKAHVWDLHEIPSFFLSGGIKRFVFRALEGRCNYVIHANGYRRDYLKDNGMLRFPEKHLVLRNFPDVGFLEAEMIDPELDSVRSWLGGAEYIYLQGLKQESRHPEQTIRAAIVGCELKIVIIGGIVPSVRSRLEAEFGEVLQERVYFCGMVDQLAIPEFLRSAKFSMIFYETTKPNNRLCEPNRMYQAVVCGKPVIVGSNAPMRDFVERHDVGVVLESDGSLVSDIEKGISDLLRDYDRFKLNTEKCKNEVMWEDQESVFREIYSVIQEAGD